ncbi:DUF4174 domain-containing protein [Leptolyngbya sp. FACHB-711]|uniref:DUF4174 domain-containing protein n=1 Tax=unclassified Leptolyngbya TaxID=2650499 RepID=UPI00168746BC|nr:DUF4174 domain-containing protein [Leptolyngbya sp. FACHB-711]MBD2025429.1 DUF4174 domain-containing protein [Leptolyngbya sp. FACHB-711]
MGMQIGTETKNSFHLDNYQWHYRALLIFSPTEQDSDFQEQIMLLRREQGGLQERELKLVYLFQDGESHADQTAISEPIAEQIRMQFAVEPDEFAVILVGKDGTQKHRYAKPISARELFGAVDAMAMRQYEMQHKR